MLFNSYIFIFVFLPIVWIGFFTIGKRNTQLASALLVLASLIFYGYWNTRYLWLLLASITVNFAIAKQLIKYQLNGLNAQSKRLLAIAITGNLLLLGYFKYLNFIINAAGWSCAERYHVAAILPLGISFYTFTQIAVLIDIYKNKLNKLSYLHYLVFITYFPHLIAGPVLHHSTIIPPLEKKSTYTINWDNMSAGVVLFAIGLFKKVYWADSLAPFVDDIFGSIPKGAIAGAIPTPYEAWAGALAYTLQIYFDFSGYSDMARGIALLFNIDLPINFNSPYRARNIIDFWRRWHMSLSVFLRDYIYIPLGGNRKGEISRYVNLFITMLIGGIWHGAGWNFILWGALHGAYLTVNHFWRGILSGKEKICLPHPVAGLVSGALTFICVVVAWVLFRSPNLADAEVILKAMFAIEYHPIAFADVAAGKLLVLSKMYGHDLAVLVITGLLWVWILPDSNNIRYTPRNTLELIWRTAAVSLLLCWTINRFGSYSPFLYYQF